MAKYSLLTKIRLSVGRAQRLRQASSYRTIIAGHHEPETTPVHLYPKMETGTVEGHYTSNANFKH